MLAGAVHICAILLVPVVARADGWSQLDTAAGEGRFAEIAVDGANTSGVLGLDPLFVTGACRLRLGQSGAGLVVEAPGRFWSLALFDPSGTIIFSLNDRTAVEGRLDMRVTYDMDEEAQDPADALEGTIDVASRSPDLIAVLRLFAPTLAERAEGQKLLVAARCFAVPEDGAAQAS
jgi:uncharacterized membrane protein